MCKIKKVGIRSIQNLFTNSNFIAHSLGDSGSLGSSFLIAFGVGISLAPFWVVWTPGYDKEMSFYVTFVTLCGIDAEVVFVSIRDVSNST